MEHRHLFPGIFDTIAMVVFLASFALPVYSTWFWASFRRRMSQTPRWRELIGITAATLATCSIAWRFVFPVVLHYRHSQVGFEDQMWWAISLWSIRIGIWISLAGSLLAFFALGRARVYAMVSSVVMTFTYFVIFALR